MKKAHNTSSTPEIVFSNSDLEGVVPRHDDPMVISSKMVNTVVKRAFIDQVSFADITFRYAFDKLRLKNLELQSYKEELIGFSREKVYPDGSITLHVSLGSRPEPEQLKLISWSLITLQHTMLF